jgi:hypothetical protein
MKHTGNPKEAVIILQMEIGLRHAVPETLRVEAGNLVVLAAVVGYDFAAFGFEDGEGLGVGLDVEGVLGLGLGDEGEVVEGRVPGAVVEDDVAEPVLFLRSVGKKKFGD